MRAIHIETPCIRSSPLSKLLGRDVYLKLENTQPTGSFKLRGIGALCVEAAQKGAQVLVSSSGGNAGVAAAFAGRVLNIATKVFVPQTTPLFMREKIQAEGAEVIVHGQVWDEANAAALKEVEKQNGFYISPFDHPTIWRGNSTMIDEVKSQVGKPALVVTAVGGGGLLLGVLEGLKRNGWSDVLTLACETEGTASFAATFAAKKLVTLPSITGVATSLGARTVAAELLKWIAQDSIQSHMVSDKAAIEAVFNFIDDHRYAVEPACGAALAPVYKAELPNVDGPVVVVVCGGAVVNSNKLSEWKQLLAHT